MTAIEQIRKHIEENKSYVLEAGAGSGKTYTLIQTINYVLEIKEESIKLNNQKIVCITYTNVAKNEIIERLENNPLVIVSTIHEFLWDCIKRFNKQLIIELDALNEFMLLNSKKPENYKTGLKDYEKVYISYHDKKWFITSSEDVEDPGEYSDISELKNIVDIDIKHNFIYNAFLKAISNYKAEELITIANECEIGLLKTNGKKKNKRDLYDEINLFKL